ncbi:PAS domain S-box protein [Seleniivibrio woodruffii]|uniref:PAS domain S-box-containing protein n=1 Tax=Seleniivibrio woodruffii TaxID=1078050 RepID=A0A4R1K8D4_9BACT|nr:PAS domain S-box protein [Seleniivibrio woodruffii]TCK60565.1 PAS domain S-box-containing protein [Seleniivibrio woodruffii]TVZ36193.1 PAS domain S-box-containing protein [Seleniivibrio woodruffii]
MLTDLLDGFIREMEAFLSGWTRHMEAAGYLEHTTAKRDDCIRSLHGVIDPMKKHLAEGKPVDFSYIMKNSRDMADSLIMMAERHKARGITAEMFFGCFKTLIHSLDDIILTSPLPSDEKLKLYIDFRRLLDSIESITIAKWDSQSRDEKVKMLEKTDRILTLAKNKYENIFQATSDMVLVTDSEGQILEMNQSAEERFGKNAINSAVWPTLGIQPMPMEELLERYPAHSQNELRLPNLSSIVTIGIVPLKKVSLASAGYVIIMNDITCIVEQRAKLEQLVGERTAALAKSENLFRSLFSSAGEGIILADRNLSVTQSNERADEMFGFGSIGLSGINCSKVFHPEGLRAIKHSFADHETGTIETFCMTTQNSTFPASITISRLTLGDEPYLHLIVRDITHQKQMEENILKEKALAEEMNVTLRNVMKTIGKEKEEMERSIAQRVTTQIMPSLQKITAEDNIEIRKMYANMLKEQLSSLTGIDAANSASLMKLSKSEIQVCQLIQSGHSSKEIGDMMNISFETVQTHRKNIRKKLGLSGKDLNLFSFLTNT